MGKRETPQESIFTQMNRLREILAAPPNVAIEALAHNWALIPGEVQKKILRRTRHVVAKDQKKRTRIGA